MTKQKFLYQLGMCIRKYRQLAGMSQEKLAGETWQCDSL